MTSLRPYNTLGLRGRTNQAARTEPYFRRSSFRNDSDAAGDFVYWFKRLYRL